MLQCDTDGLSTATLSNATLIKASGQTPKRGNAPTPSNPPMIASAAAYEIRSLGTPAVRGPRIKSVSPFELSTPEPVDRMRLRRIQ